MEHSVWRAVGSLSEVVGFLAKNPSCPSSGVYVIEFDSGASKIGCAGEPAKRVAAIARQLEIYGGWKTVRVAVSDGCTNQYQVEAALHRHFAGVRLEGELFRVSIEDVAPVLATIELLDETDRREGEKDDLVNIAKAIGAYKAETELDEEYSRFGEAADVIREDDELLEHMSDLLLGATVFARKFALDIADAMDCPPTSEEKCAILERVSKAISDAMLAELGPESAIVVLEKEDGYRELSAVQNPESIGEHDPRGRVVTIIKSNPAAPA